MRFSRIVDAGGREAAAVYIYEHRDDIFVESTGELGMSIDEALTLIDALSEAVAVRQREERS